MSRLLKILGFLIAIFLLVLAAVFFLANRYLTEDRVKALIIPPLEEATGLKISIGQIKRKGFTSVKISEVKFSDPETNQKVIGVEELRLSLRFVPLLRGEVVVGELLFKRPSLLVTREEDGRLNLEKYWLKEEKRGGPKKPSKPSAPKLAFIFQNLKIQRARIAFLDRKGELPPIKAEISFDTNLAFSRKGLALKGQGVLSSLEVASFPLGRQIFFTVDLFPQKARIRLTKGFLLEGKINGEIHFSGQDLRGEILLSRASFEALGKFAEHIRPYSFPETELPSISGAFDLRIDLSGTMAKPSYKVTLSPNPLAVEYPPYHLEVRGEALLSDNILRPEFSIGLNGESFKLKGLVSDLDQSLPKVDFLLTAERLKLKTLVPEKRSSQAPKGSSQGSASSPFLLIPAQGRLRFQVKELCYQVCSQDVSGEVVFSPKVVELKDLRLILAKAQTQITGKMTHLVKQPQISLNFSLAGMELPLLLQDLWPGSAYVSSGKVWAEGVFQTKGVNFLAWRKNLSGKGVTVFENLGFKESPLSIILAKVLKTPKLKQLRFQKGKAGFVVKQGQISVQGKFYQKELKLFLKGEIGLDGQLNLRPLLVFEGPLASELKTRFPPARFFEKGKSIEIPLQLKGTFSKPKISVPLQQELQEKIQEKFLQFLGN